MAIHVYDCNKVIDSLSDDELVVWEPLFYVSQCQLSLQLSQYSYSQVATITAELPTYGYPPKPLPSCLGPTTTPSCRNFVNCVDLLYTASASTYLDIWHTWNWNDSSHKIDLPINKQVSLFYCGQPLLIQVTIRFIKPPRTTVSSNTIEDPSSSWNAATVMTKVVLPTMCAALLIIIISLMILCVIKKLMGLRGNPSSRPTDRNEGVSNMAYLDDPPMYADYNKYPLSESFQKQMQQKSSNAGSLHVTFHTSPSTAVDSLHENTTPSAPGLDGEEYQPVTPPPLYKQTRRVVLNDLDNISIYEVIEDEDGIAVQPPYPMATGQSSGNHESGNHSDKISYLDAKS